MITESTSTTPRLTCNIHGKQLLFSLLLLALLIHLGFWQLERAEQKRLLLRAFERQWQSPVENMDALSDDRYQPYQRVALHGQFQTRSWFLLDNRIWQGQAGYDVLVPFVTNGGQQVLVNRGWIKGNPDRSVLPEVQHPQGDVRLVARLHTPDPGIMLSRRPERPQPVVTDADSVNLSNSPSQINYSWPKVIQQEDVSLVTQLLGYSPVWVRIDENDPSALSVQWSVVNTQPEKHVAYAVQWFLMAIVLVIFSVFANSNLASVIRCVLNNKSDYQGSL